MKIEGGGWEPKERSGTPINPNTLLLGLLVIIALAVVGYLGYGEWRDHKACREFEGDLALCERFGLGCPSLIERVNSPCR